VAEKTLYDFLGSAPSGINSGIDPLLLHKTQFAFAYNRTFRGNFCSQRPPFQAISLSYAKESVETNFQTGLFQGAGYYKPDYGGESVCLTVAGHIFLFTPGASESGIVSEITIPNDPNPTTQSQGWFCQSENFLIWNDGLTLPFFFDGTTARRSFGPTSQILGTALGGETVPAIGASINIALTTPYTGPRNVLIYIGTATYVVTAVGSLSSLVTLENQSDTPSNTVLPGQELVVEPSFIGLVTATTVSKQLFMDRPVPAYVHAGNSAVFQGITSTITSIGPLRNYIIVGVPTNNIPGIIGSAVTFIGSAPPNINVGIVGAAFTVPTVGSTVNVLLSTPYTGATGQTIFIGNGRYVISNTGGAPPLGATEITVQNISDTPGYIVTGVTLRTIPELPAGRQLVYGMGRTWEAMTDGISFLGSDIVDSSSGSPAYTYRDSVLKITQNQFINAGGLFRVPGTVGAIQAMQFVAQLDVSLGQGPLQVFTTTNVFSCQAPVDQTTWYSVTNPILTQALIGAGAISEDAVSPANGDLIFRSADGLIRSLLLARLDFNQWGNTPISREVDRVLSTENLTLLPFSTSTVFDNRFLMGAGLAQSARGVYSTSLIALNFDPISSLRGKAPSIYDGQWAGLNILKLVTGYFGGVQRCFAVCLSQELSQIEIHEVLITDAQNYDDGSTPITSYFESPVIFSYELTNPGNRPANPNHEYLRLSYGEIYIDQMVGPVQFLAFWKPDQWPTWIPWYSWTQPCDPHPPTNDPGFRPRIGLPMPNANIFDRTNNRPLREGYCFQFKLIMTGKCRFLGARFSADVIPEPKFAAHTPTTQVAAPMNVNPVSTFAGGSQSVVNLVPSGATYPGLGRYFIYGLVSTNTYTVIWGPNEFSVVTTTGGVFFNPGNGIHTVITGGPGVTTMNFLPKGSIPSNSPVTSGIYLGSV